MLLLIVPLTLSAGIKVTAQNNVTSFWGTCKDVVDYQASKQPYRNQLTITICFGQLPAKITLLVSQNTNAPKTYPIELQAKGQLKANKCYLFRFTFDASGQLNQVIDITEFNCQTGKPVGPTFVINPFNCPANCAISIKGPLSTEKKLDLFFSDLRLPDDVLQFKMLDDAGELGDPILAVPYDQIKLLLQKQEWKQVQDAIIKHHQNLLETGVIKPGTLEADPDYFIKVNKAMFPNPAEIKKVFTGNLTTKLN